MTVTGYCVGGLLSDPDPAVFDQSLDDNRRIIEEAAEIDAQCVVFLAGGLAVGVKNIDAARDRALEGLSLLIPEARAAGVVLGLEPLHPMVCASRSVLSTMKAANDWRDQLEAPDVVGIVVDTYNVWWDPDLSQEIVRAGQAICAFHVADWLIDTGDLRLDRGMPGDGVIDIPGIRTLVENAGYTGRREVEIFSQDNWWRRDPDEVLEIIKARYGHSI
jgi:sugar phosphate isomerase/epimerase